MISLSTSSNRSKDLNIRNMRRCVPLQGLREVGDSVILMGKNTMMKRSIRLYCERTGDEKWTSLLDVLLGNVGLVFTKADLPDVRLSAPITRAPTCH